MAAKKLTTKEKSLRLQLKTNNEYINKLTTNFEMYEQENKVLQIKIKNKEDDLKKLKEVFKLEEQDYLNRISDLECSIQDSFEDNERLEAVISTLGGKISNLEKTNRMNIKRFRRNYNNNKNYATIESPSFDFKGANFKYDPDAPKISNNF